MTWAYEIDVGTISGEVEAGDEEAAMRAAADDVSFRSDEIVAAGTWRLRQVDDE